MLTIDALDGCVVDGSQRGVLDPEVGTAFHVHLHQLLTDGLQCSSGRCIRLNVHVQVKAVILAAEQCLLILVLPHVLHTHLDVRSGQGRAGQQTGATPLHAKRLSKTKHPATANCEEGALLSMGNEPVH